MLKNKTNKKMKMVQELTRNVNEQYQQDKYNYINKQKGNLQYLEGFQESMISIIQVGLQSYLKA